MDPFVEEILELVGTALRQAGAAELPEGLARMIERPPDPAMGDYAMPCFTLAKALRKPPPAISSELAAVIGERLTGSRLLSGVVAAGPYLNFRVNTAAMAGLTVPAILDGSYFGRNRERQGDDTTAEKVMVEYSQPNTHKAFHVGHMRNVALGDALVRILEYDGRQVVAANYIGDVGTHIARCLWYYENHREELPPQYHEPPGEEHPEERGEWLGMLYTAAVQKITGSEEQVRLHYDREVSRVLQALESREGEVFALWEQTRAWSLEAFGEIYRWLGARFDHVFYESDMDRLGRQMVDDGLAAGVFVHSQGAVGTDMEEHGLGFFLVLKGDGTTLYATKDLALARIKFEQFGIARSIYVVGAEQKLHFRQVFKSLELLGFSQATLCHHLAYGLVVLPEGKMSSRQGNTIPFSQLRREVNDYIETNYMSAHREAGIGEDDGLWSAEEIQETTRRIAVAGIRYGMVKQDPARQIVFNLEDWLVSEGDTGTYLCYAYTRIQSVLRQVQQARGAEPDPAAPLEALTHENERALISDLHDFNRVARRAAENLAPHLVANAVFQLCKSFSRAYATCPVLRAETEELMAARLALFAATGRLLLEGLRMLGIEPPERM